MLEERINQRLRDMFAHIGMAVALHYASTTIANVYGIGVNLQLPLPPYPGVIWTPERRLVLP